MTVFIAFIFAQSLLGDLGAKATAADPVVQAAPEPAAAVEVAAEQAAVVVAEEPVAAVVAEEPAKVEVAIEKTAAEAEGAGAEKPHKAKDGRPEMPRSVKITSERTDYDRREGVIMFDRNVFVDDDEYKMHSDQLYVFLDGTNELKRIVAIGNVSITNDTRVGTCSKAAYTKNVGKIVMYGDSSGAKAKLADMGKRKSEVEGRKITFWIDSEQVEVEGSTVTLDAGGFGGKEGAKKLLGK